MNSGKKITLIIAVIALAAVVLALTFDYASGRKQEYQNTPTLSVVANPNNWQGALQDVMQSSPVKNGSGTQSAGTISTQTDTQSTDTQSVDADDSNNTDKIGVDFFSHYLNMEQNGAISDNSNATDTAIGLSDELLAVDNPSTPYTVYATSSMTVATDETPTTIEAYGNALGTIMLQDSPQNLQNELIVVDQASEQNDPSPLAALDTNIGAYQQILSDYSALAVPESALSLHIQLLDTISQLSAADTAMEQLFTDPVTAASGLGTYNNAAANLKNIIDSYTAYFASKGVDFSPSSRGYSFTHL